MTHNSFLLLRGMKKQIYLSRHAAEKVKTILEDKNIPSDTWLDIEGTGFRKGEIKYVEVNGDGSTAESNEKERDKFYEEERRVRGELVRRSAEVKASKLDMFDLLYQLTTGKKPTAEKQAEAQKIQQTFFEQHPNRTLCDPSELKAIIPMERGRKLNPYEQGGMQIIEKAILRDMALEK